LGLVTKPFNNEQLTGLRGKEDGDGKYTSPSRGWMHLIAATVEKPDEFVCDIWFVKNVLAGDPDLELGTYAAEHPSFPSTSTSNQFYGEYDFEAYRLRGFTNTTTMMDAMTLFESGGTPAGPPSGTPPPPGTPPPAQAPAVEGPPEGHVPPA